MRENKVIVIAYLSYMALGVFDGLLGVVWPAMSITLGVPLQSLGILLMVALAGFVLVSFNSGSIIRARSFHWFLLVSLIVRALSFIGLALFPSWPVVILMIFIMGLGSGGIDSGLNTFVSQRGNARQINWLHAAFGIGATTGPFLAAGVQAAGGAWTWNFALVAAFVSVIILLVWRTAPYWQIEASSKKGEGPAARDQAKFVDSLRLPVVWVSTILFFLYVGTELTAGQWSFSLFTLGRGIPDLAAKFWVGIYWGIFTLGRVLFGLVADRVPLNSFLRGALAASAAGAMLLLWNPVPEIGLAGLVLMGLAQAPIFPSLIASTISRVGRDHAPNAIGFQVAAGGIGGTAITSLVGLLASSLGLETIAVSIVVLALLTLLAYELVLLISARHKPAAPLYAG